MPPKTGLLRSLPLPQYNIINTTIDPSCMNCLHRDSFIFLSLRSGSNISAKPGDAHPSPRRCEFSSVLRRKEYIENYRIHYEPAEPEEDFEDRIRLYSLKAAINYSAGHPGCLLRKTAYNDMCYLCEKYAPIDGIDKYNPQLDPE
ncbi:uncharacterized protein THITE_116263 [Thermothielavioides terrestris NRRL 8126]|uniref:Uncharacterized protein n=1 Tax=Thermothielavioides terrestris (strain ATCC 38088 / NRRL 8126) TaxID=578455 RepID=G2QVZ4_THETT|nr:uncharacterized protein THITE_116263 [Thermothielavioides terrestris NRRL 8126]AEO64726.1 hypothetical protein THITE_116263 [Thermothielavioides terrestris NRRL 8126]